MKIRRLNLKGVLGAAFWIWTATSFSPGVAQVTDCADYWVPPGSTTRQCLDNTPLEPASGSSDSPDGQDTEWTLVVRQADGLEYLLDEASVQWGDFPALRTFRYRRDARNVANLELQPYPFKIMDQISTVNCSLYTYDQGETTAIDLEGNVHRFTSKERGQFTGYERGQQLPDDEPKFLAVMRTACEIDLIRNY